MVGCGYEEMDGYETTDTLPRRAKLYFYLSNCTNTFANG